MFLVVWPASIDLQSGWRNTMFYFFWCYISMTLMRFVILLNELYIDLLSLEGMNMNKYVMIAKLIF